MALSIVLCLAIAGVAAFPIIGYVGVSPFGEIGLGGGTLTGAANASYWDMASSFQAFGVSLLLPLIAGGLIALLAATYLVTSFSMKE